jgi:hypothetical protein
MSNQSRSKLRKQRRESGLCICGRKPAGSKRACVKCTEVYNRARRRFRAAHPDRVSRTIMSWVKRHRNERATYHRKWTKRNLEHKHDYGRRGNIRLRLQTLLHYGNKCACCGEKDLRFLTIDHTNGHGNEHRRKIGKRGGGAFYRWLRDHGFPKGYQTLCWNCNCGKSVYGKCPHSFLMSELLSYVNKKDRRMKYEKQRRFTL